MEDGNKAKEEGCVFHPTGGDFDIEIGLQPNYGWISILAQGVSMWLIARKMKDVLSYHQTVSLPVQSVTCFCLTKNRPGLCCLFQQRRVGEVGDCSPPHDKPQLGSGARGSGLNQPSLEYRAALPC